MLLLKLLLCSDLRQFWFKTGWMGTSSYVSEVHFVYKKRVQKPYIGVVKVTLQSCQTITFMCLLFKVQKTCRLARVTNIEWYNSSRAAFSLFRWLFQNKCIFGALTVVIDYTCTKSVYSGIQVSPQSATLQVPFGFRRRFCGWSKAGPLRFDVIEKW